MSKYVRDKAHCKHESYTKEDIDNMVDTINDTLGNKVDETNVYVKDDYVVLTGSVAKGETRNTHAIDYPEGFNLDNCVVIGVQQQIYNDDGSRDGFWIYSSKQTAYGYTNITLMDDVILIDFWTTSPLEENITFGGAGIDYKITLMKIS